MNDWHFSLLTLLYSLTFICQHLFFYLNMCLLFIKSYHIVKLTWHGKEEITNKIWYCHCWRGKVIVQKVPDHHKIDSVLSRIKKMLWVNNQKSGLTPLNKNSVSNPSQQTWLRHLGVLSQHICYRIQRKILFCDNIDANADKWHIWKVYFKLKTIATVLFLFNTKK